MARALFVGGCPAPYHRLEPAIAPITSALSKLGLDVDVSGITHPDGGDTFTGDYTMLTEPHLGDYQLLVLFTTGRDRFGASPDEICKWVESGRALVGIHCATDTFTDDPQWVSLWGGRFRTHPAQLDIQLEIVDNEHVIMQGVSPFTVHDELYLFADYAPETLHLLAQTRSFDDGGPVPVAWTREPGKGRLFYLSTGHNPSTMEDPAWQRLFSNGVTWALEGVRSNDG